MPVRITKVAVSPPHMEGSPFGEEVQAENLHVARETLTECYMKREDVARVEEEDWIKTAGFIFLWALDESGNKVAGCAVSVD